MGKIRISENFSIEEFAKEYFSIAINLAKECPCYDDFYRGLFGKISRDFGITIEAVKHIHHSFHWYLFCEEDSILLNNPPKTHKDIAKVSLRNGREIDESALVSGFLDKYRGLLEQRIKRLPPA